LKIAIIGSGISGLTAAYHLNQKHEITLYEANDYVGGHTHTHSIKKSGNEHFIDTGFIVFNKKTYPNFLELIEELGVDYCETSMSFSVSSQRNGMEYNGTSLNQLFADRMNLLRPSFYIFLRGILDFNKKATLFLKNSSDISLGDFFKEQNIKSAVVESYLIPMIAAVWSSDPIDVHKLPAKFILRFFENHGFLEVDDRPQWYVIKGGSHSYVKKITKGFKDKILLSTPVKSIKRFSDHVIIETNSSVESFDAVVLATHSDISLKLIDRPTHSETEILSAIAYTKNPTILHQDRSFLPKRKRAWAAWNYILSREKCSGASVTYNMNILQNLQQAELFNVTLNPSHEINPESILKSLNYEHPLFTLKGVVAQERWKEISSHNRTFYCGAYWRNGFHEDGVVSALRVVKQLETQCIVESIKVL